MNVFFLYYIIYIFIFKHKGGEKQIVELMHQHVLFYRFGSR